MGYDWLNPIPHGVFWITHTWGGQIRYASSHILCRHINSVYLLSHCTLEGTFVFLLCSISLLVSFLSV